MGDDDSLNHLDYAPNGIAAALSQESFQKIMEAERDPSIEILVIDQPGAWPEFLFRKDKMITFDFEGKGQSAVWDIIDVTMMGMVLRRVREDQLLRP